jgi:glycosyltransferase involved in cell wall biosynthesis
MVIPVKNMALRLETLLESLARQMISHEVIVVHNGSEDESLTVSSSTNARVLEGKRRRVRGLRNPGVSCASSDFIRFVDSDHELPTDWLGKGLERL